MSPEKPSETAPSGSAAPAQTKALAGLALPAIAVGVVSALSLAGVSTLASLLQGFLWDALPQAFGLAAGTPWWPVVVLTLTGVAVGVTIRFVPGHAGGDPLRSGLVGAPLPIGVVPGLAVALVLGLAGGVSLGPENPIIAINVALAVWLIARPKLSITAPVADTLAAAGTLGAMFASPLAAILLLTESLGGTSSSRLFDRLFGPLCAASAGALTMQFLGVDGLSASIAPYDNPSLWDLLSGPVAGVLAAGVALIAVWLVPWFHRAFHRLRSPIIALGLGGFVLGLLGMVGGHDHITMFKGLAETQRLVVEAPKEHWGALLILGLALVKALAIAVAAGAGFRGGRIFPAVFLGAASGLAITQVVPSVPPAVAISCGVLGAVVIVARDGWCAIFIGAVMVGDVRVLPIMCLAMIPVWLLSRGRPLMQLDPSSEPEYAALAAKG